MDTQRLIDLLDAARDYICEGGSINLIGARQLVNEIDAEVDKFYEDKRNAQPNVS